MEPEQLVALQRGLARLTESGSETTRWEHSTMALLEGEGQQLVQATNLGRL